MGKHQINSSLILAAVGLLGLSGCASDGGFASGSKPLDKEATRIAVCTGAQKIDIAFWAINTSAPGVIPPNVMDVEGTAIATLGFQAGNPNPAAVNTVCAAVYTGNLDVAINTAIIATVQISKLIQTWQK